MARSAAAPPPASSADADDMVRAALRAAADLGIDVADVPAPVIARYAGVSRSTLLRRFGGSRAGLDQAVRASGVDPGGAPPVRARALDAAASVITEDGLAATTFEAVAARADCSVPSLYAIFGTRDGLLGAVFERYSPLVDIEDFLSGDTADLRATVHRLYGLIGEAFSRQPRVAPAMFAEAIARPSSPVAQSLATLTGPRVLAVIGGWLTAEIQAGRIVDLPIPILVQQLLAPMVIHMVLRPGEENVPSIDLPDLDAARDMFTATFLRAVGTEAMPAPRARAKRSSGRPRR
ncbi:TetR/AcrR family transcriptional regulator [Mycolicibacterium septicum]|uniref:TetR/AcrR family transcriptional regulator n=1 Tax=Mycolicibacterium septicum TaxID=98668 RepID=UPI00235FA70B|nr:TetR/AcrR family transcriptional regulator [Mycolicibacterium septicum]